VGTIVVGVACVVAGEAAFSGIGFTLVMAAAALSGLRWTLTQLLMRSSAADGSGMAHPLVLLWRVLPVMAAAAGVASLLLEQPWHRLPNSPYGDTVGHAAATIAMLMLAACLAFGMSMAEFALVHDTSAVTLAVTGTCKEAVIVALAALIDGDSFGPLNGVGLLLVIAGVGVYNWARHTAAQQRKAAAAAAAVGESGGGGAGGDGGGAGAASPPAEAHGSGGAASPRRARLAEAEEGRVVAPAAAGAGLPHHRTRSSVAGASQQRGSLDVEGETYTDVLNALLQNKTR
jgi:solute carrier family 35 protein C2